MYRLFIVFFIIFIMLVPGCGETSSGSSNLTNWTLSNPYNVGGDGTLSLSSTTEGKLDIASNENIKNVVTSLNNSKNSLGYIRDENGNLLSGNINSSTTSVDLSF